MMNTRDVAATSFAESALITQVAVLETVAMIAGGAEKIGLKGVETTGEVENEDPHEENIVESMEDHETDIHPIVMTCLHPLRG